MVDSDAHTKCDIHQNATHIDDGSLTNSPRRHSSVDEIFDRLSTANINGQRPRSSSDSEGPKEKNLNGNYLNIQYFL